ncbi:type II secretory pathway pseudopilin PulG [Haloferula luteola]|uniref:Type II secretory pathway pseudopilin PulG n=1 Tax=Haloferula luteola TaxID=595692 RepID=A0A840VI05_9BACT|nr:hypothetical protein [Haloferula luteola]MBB5352361.1 type II secretory pathway pseudopilin PulG [Haloferula luteola]
MKLQNQTKRAKGMTLLELTVVILVLLSLISILFVGARAWKKGSDRAGCIMNIRNVQQAARGYQNMYGLSEGAGLTSDKLIGTGGYLENAPTCPGSGDYSFGTTVPAVGDLYMTCSLAGEYDEEGTLIEGSDLGHTPTGHDDW